MSTKRRRKESSDKPADGLKLKADKLVSLVQPETQPETEAETEADVTEECDSWYLVGDDIGFVRPLTVGAKPCLFPARIGELPVDRQNKVRSLRLLDKDLFVLRMNGQLQVFALPEFKLRSECQVTDPLDMCTFKSGGVPVCLVVSSNGDISTWRAKFSEAPQIQRLECKIDCAKFCFSSDSAFPRLLVGRGCHVYEYEYTLAEDKPKPSSKTSNVYILKFMSRSYPNRMLSLKDTWKVKSLDMVNVDKVGDLILAGGFDGTLRIFNNSIESEKLPNQEDDDEGDDNGDSDIETIGNTQPLAFIRSLPLLIYQLSGEKRPITCIVPHEDGKVYIGDNVGHLFQFQIQLKIERDSTWDAPERAYNLKRVQINQVKAQGALIYENQFCKFKLQSQGSTRKDGATIINATIHQDNATILLMCYDRTLKIFDSNLQNKKNRTPKSIVTINQTPTAVVRLPCPLEFMS